MNTLAKRIEREVFELIAPEFGRNGGHVRFDTSEGTWVSITHVPVPRDLMDNKDGRVSILLLIPQSYPQVPPDGFYCDQGLKIKNHYFLGFRDKYYPELQQNLLQQGWQWFCMHAAHDRSMMNWRVSADPHQGDNLLKYMRLCLAILGKEAVKLKTNEERQRRLQSEFPMANAPDDDFDDLDEDDIPPWLRPQR